MKRSKVVSKKVCGDNCREVAYNGEHSNGDVYHLCPLHGYEGFAHDLDALIRNCGPINGKLTEGEAEVISYIREQVNYFLSEGEREYKLLSDIRKRGKIKKRSAKKNK